MQSVELHSLNPTPAVTLSHSFIASRSLAVAHQDALLAGYLSLCQLVDDPRWITLVADKSIDLFHYKPLFGAHKRLRIIQAANEDLLWIVWQCLAQGNSQSVIAMVDTLQPQDQAHLQHAAELGQSSLHLVTTD